MLSFFARLATTRTRLVLVLALAFFLVAGATGGSVPEKLTMGGFVDPGSDSGLAEEVLADQFDAGAPNVLLVVTAREGGVDDAEVAAAGEAVTDALASEDGVDDVLSYWSEGNAPPLRSEDGTRALVIGRIDSQDDDDINTRIEELAPALRALGDGTPVTVQVGGFAELYRELAHTIETDLLRAEMIALPITLILLVVIFGSVVSALLPLAIGALSVVGTFLVLTVLVTMTDVSIFALSLTTALGLGLAIDYSLFVVARYREELRLSPDDPRAAVTRTVQTAGRTVAFSALTVAAAMSALLVFPLGFLRSYAYAGVAVALLAGVFSLVVLPAILAGLGHKVNSLTLWKKSVATPEQGIWSKIATFVMKRPVPVAVAVVAALLVLGAPFLNLHTTQPDERVLPEDSVTRGVHEIIGEEFSSTDEGTLTVVARTTDGATEADVDAYASRLAMLPGVSRVDASTGTYCGAGGADVLGCEAGDLVVTPDSSPRYEGFDADGGTYLSVVPSVAPLSAEGEGLVHAVRGADAPFPVVVGGAGAELIDTNKGVADQLPLALGIIGVITLVLLFLMFGSVVIPLKAIVLNLLSLSATLGAMVWVFQEGHLAGVLGVTPTEGVSVTIPIMMFCIAFGLSMDYEVFLLSRIKEEHDRGATNEAAVAVGLQRTGRIVTAAAVLISVVFLSFATSGVSFIKLYGIGLSLAVLLDAFVIRGTLVPAFMQLAGEWNWWAPGPLRRFHDRFGISESGPAHEAPAATTTVKVRDVAASTEPVAAERERERSRLG